MVSELPDSARRNPELRRVAMRRQVAEAGFVRVDALASEYGVSIMTVHRDLDELERLGFLHKVRGGATSAPTTTFHGDLEHRMQAQVDAKLAIAREVLRSEVESGQVIALDDSTTSLVLARLRPYWRPGAAFGYHGYVIGALAGEVVRRVTGRSIQELFEERVRAPHGLDFHLGLPEELEPRFATTLPMLPTLEQQAEIDAEESAEESLRGIAFNRHRAEVPELWEFPNQRIVRAQGQTSAGGVATARGLAGMYAAATTGLNGRPPLLKPDTMAAVAQIQSIGYDVVSRVHKAYGLGFSVAGEFYPFLGQGAFGYSGAAGSQALADPRSGFAYGYTRRRFAYPGGAAPENDRLLRACVTAARATL